MSFRQADAVCSLAAGEPTRTEIPRTFYGEPCRLPSRPESGFEFAQNLVTLAHGLRKMPLGARHASTFRTVPDFDDVKARILRVEPELRDLGIERLWVFGSTARGDANFDSDVDVAMSPNGLCIHRAAVVLQRELKRHVDVVGFPLHGFLKQAEGDLAEIF